MSIPIDVLQCTHGNELLGLVLDGQISSNPIPGVRSRIAHPEAAKRGVRFIGTESQLQMHYPGNPAGDPEDRAAYENMRWLGAHAGSTEAIVYDVHSNDFPGLDAFSVGKRALKTAMVGAWLLGYDKCYLIDDPFRRAVPNAALLENSIPETEFSALAKYLHAALGDLALMDIAELSARYEEMTASVQFYTKHEIPTTTATGKLQPYIPGLEAIPGEAAFTPVDLSLAQREALGIPDDIDGVFMESWGHRNNSKVLADLGGTRDGTPRRAYFGGYFLPAQAPSGIGHWVTAENIPSM